jgi:hypothetical protein
MVGPAHVSHQFIGHVIIGHMIHVRLIGQSSA